MPGGQHNRRHGGGGGYGYGLYPYPVAPSYAVVDPALATGKGACGCSGGSGSGALSGVTDWVSQNPLVALLGAFAVGWLVMGKKGGF